MASLPQAALDELARSSMVMMHPTSIELFRTDDTQRNEFGRITIVADTTLPELELHFKYSREPTRTTVVAWDPAA